MTGESRFVAIATEADEDRRWELVSGWVTSDPSCARLAADAQLASYDAPSRQAAAELEA
jgi:hypothetical protein